MPLCAYYYISNISNVYNIHSVSDVSSLQLIAFSSHLNEIKATLLIYLVLGMGHTKYTTPFHTIQIYIASENLLPPSGKSW